VDLGACAQSVEVVVAITSGSMVTARQAGWSSRTSRSARERVPAISLAFGSSMSATQRSAAVGVRP